jgi:hypothetical protein
MGGHDSQKLRSRRGSPSSSGRNRYSLWRKIKTLSQPTCRITLSLFPHAAVPRFRQHQHLCPLVARTAIPSTGPTDSAINQWRLGSLWSRHNGPITHCHGQVDRHGNVLRGRLTDHSVARVVKRRAAAVGLTVDSFAGHSLRSGFVTTAVRAGEPVHKIMRQTGHKSVEMVLKYVRRANAFADNAALSLGL